MCSERGEKVMENNSYDVREGQRGEEKGWGGGRRWKRCKDVIG